MKGFKYVQLLILVLVIGAAIYITVQPNSFEVTRSRTIKAPAAVIYDHIIDFKNWEAWSPWIEQDSTIILTYPEQTKGVGGSYSWRDKDGVGTMKTLEAEADRTITQEMQFEDFPPSTITWRFNPMSSGETEVTWAISGEDLPFGFKMYTVLKGGMEEQIGPNFERGLEKLDSMVIADMNKYHITIEGQTEYSGGYYLYNTTSCKISDFESKMMEMMPKVEQFVTDHHINTAGASFVSFLKWDEANNATIFSCCVPTSEKVIATESDIQTGKLEPFKAIKTTLTGDYEHLKEAWDKAMQYVTDTGYEFTQQGPMLEVYQTNPENTPNPSKWITEIYIAVK
ncbi:SRPBCC family protein [Aestuariivivens sediminis]|uniref:SRPBCC family protein n=1 Tax=Aestuariivivens sediminis TaxID=2913557 RepID=UPI001F591022|nr:SRPBCC family protein [Aestuariivivens sediminis]